MNGVKILPVIVLYNSILEEQNTYKSLLKSECWDKYIVYDNSDTNIKNKIEDPRAIYIRDINNSGLSKAYNIAASYAKAMGYEWLLILDQDSYFPTDSYMAYRIAIENNKGISLFAPRLIYKFNKPFSPSKLCCGFPIVKRLDEGIYSLHKYVPVNSGMCFSIKEFDKCGGYDENLQLDFTDIRFIDKFKEYNDSFYLLDCNVIQSFSNEVKDYCKLLSRYKQYLRDASNYPNKGTIRKISLFVLVLKHTLSLTLKTKKNAFISYYINHYLFKKK
ncbi:MAG: glycosyltransferase [Prevotella sp.]|nr:glycosyltransferase [Prevotella sp.]